MTVWGKPRPLPECRRCSAPMRRTRWAIAAGLCSSCATPADALQTAQRAARLNAVHTTRSSRADDRINRLAARRAARPTTERSDRG